MSLNLPSDLKAVLAQMQSHSADLQDGDPVSPSPVMTSTYALSGDPIPGLDFYGRNGNPMWRHVEAVIGALEGGEAVLFPSGMAAASACLIPFLKTGDTLLIPNDGYYTVRDLAERFLKPFGIEVRYYETTKANEQDLEGVSLMWLETPSNPGLDVCDLAALSKAAQASGTMLVADNTTMTPLGQSCLAYGVDLVIASDTKAMNGHSDILAGHVAGKSEELLERVRLWRTKAGPIPSSLDAWLLHRGLQTLELRLSRACDNALALAECAKGHGAVQTVRHPHLPGDPSFEIASKQMRAGGPLLTLYFEGKNESVRFLAALNQATVATSFGGIHSLAERRQRWEADNHPGLVRFAAGCEPLEPLLEDFARALDAV